MENQSISKAKLRHMKIMFIILSRYTFFTIHMMDLAKIVNAAPKIRSKGTQPAVNFMAQSVGFKGSDGSILMTTFLWSVRRPTSKVV
jgi:hypothetical protein